MIAWLISIIDADILLWASQSLAAYQAVVPIKVNFKLTCWTDYYQSQWMAKHIWRRGEDMVKCKRSLCTACPMYRCTGYVELMLKTRNQLTFATWHSMTSIKEPCVLSHCAIICNTVSNGMTLICHMAKHLYIGLLVHNSTKCLAMHKTMSARSPKLAEASCQWQMWEHHNAPTTYDLR